MNDVTKFFTKINDQTGSTKFEVRTYERDSSAAISPPPRFCVTSVRDEDGQIIWEEGDGASVDQHIEGIVFAKSKLNQMQNVS